MVKFHILLLSSIAYAASIQKFSHKLPRNEAYIETFRGEAQPNKLNLKDTSSSVRGLSGNFDGSYNIRFSQCVDVKLRDDDLFEDGIVTYTKLGEILSTKSYVLFHLCQNNDCYYESDDDLYIIDLPTFLKNTATYHTSRRTDYCEACNAYLEYCNPSDDNNVAADEDNNADQEDADGNNEADAQEVEQEAENGGGDVDENDGGERKLRSHRFTKNIIDCDQCSAYNCYDQADDAQQSQESIDSDVASMISDLSSCLATGQYWNNQQLYISAICSPYGDGVELAVFLDDACTVYTNQFAFNDVFQNYVATNNEQDLSSYAETYIKKSFEETMPCMDLNFADPDEENDDDGAGDEVNDYCEQIFYNGALSFNSCNNNNYGFGSNYNDDDALNWYAYDMTLNEATDIYDVCSVVYQMSGEYYYSYDEEKSGTWYERDASGTIKATAKSNQSKELSSVAVTLLLMLGIAVIGVAAYASHRRKRFKKMEPLYQGGAML